MLQSLRDRGFEIRFLSHAEAILSVDFPQALQELEKALGGATVPIEEIIAGGGGESKGTQRLRRALNALNWPKALFEVEKHISVRRLRQKRPPAAGEADLVNRERLESQSHEIDHVRSFEEGPKTTRVALEIEWNNKDPFFDRDLENFKRLHADGAISVGVIVTRGQSLQDSMHNLVMRFLNDRNISDLEALRDWGYDPTAKQRRAIEGRAGREKSPVPFRSAFTDKFVADKFGEATTHWRKLEDRINRGVGNPCPLLLVGLPTAIVTFEEGQSALAEVERLEHGEADEG